MLVKASTRLNRISKLSTQKQYQHIYDLCCDHGLLGLLLHEAHPQAHIHFIDIKKHIINELEQKLDKSKFDFNFTLKARDICGLDIFDHSLVCLAGVGANLIIKFLEKSMNLNQQFDLIICCNQHIHKLRKFLFDHQFKVYCEEVLLCQNQFYEIISLGPHADKEISLISSGISLCNNQHLEYVSQQQNYFATKAHHTDDQTVHSLLERYTSLKRKFICTE
ncbi:MAG: hypothetical protein CME62_05885 [Halobacteriovoraceae bacterium]|nr:hypothetical protein [Halobacteriovoraceae bacterium]|tara:strand:+ start:6261 stop:6923 length:663 start_codon:yes stop_codon:yes gene_type:complete